MCAILIKLHPDISGEEYVQLVTVEFAVDLGSGLRWVKTPAPCLLLLTEVFQLKIHWAEVQSCLMELFSCSVP
jgi:hypothetical protein